jgi:glycosyltransferase involved in cell wall biosynthesis
MLKIFGNSADRIIAVSGYMRRRLWALVKDQSRIKLIYNAIDTEKFRPDGEWGKICRERHQIADSDIVIGYLGRLHYIKGVDIAIKTFAELRQKHHNLKLMIVGDGEQMEYYKKLAVSSGVASDIIFTDFTCEPQKIINAFDIALIPSRKESFGIVALEFMSAGVPVVASAVDGLKEVVADRIDGILSDNDPAALAKCVSRLIQDEALRDDLRSGGLEKVKQFNIKAYNARINNLYKSLYE